MFLSDTIFNTLNINEFFCIYDNLSVIILKRHKARSVDCVVPSVELLMFLWDTGEGYTTERVFSPFISEPVTS